MKYLHHRIGTYEYRTIRFRAVYDKMQQALLEKGDLVVDLGAGMCDFGRYLYATHAFDGRYVPVDAAIDGCDLETWRPVMVADFHVLIETVEHLTWENAVDLLDSLKDRTTKAIILTTPNPEVWEAKVGSVANLDPTHLSQFTAGELQRLGFYTETQMCFGKPDDTIIACWGNPSWQTRFYDAVLPELRQRQKEDS